MAIIVESPNTLALPTEVLGGGPELFTVITHDILRQLIQGEGKGVMGEPAALEGEARERLGVWGTCWEFRIRNWWSRSGCL